MNEQHAESEFCLRRCTLSGKTENGSVYVRWAGGSGMTGWYAVGTRKPSFGKRPTFWETVYSLACESGNGNVDAVHAVGPDILSVGGLGLSVVTGQAQMLLGRCLTAHPTLYLDAMAPIIRTTGMYLTEERPDWPTPVYVFGYTGGPHVGLDNALVVRAGGDGRVWSREAKEQSRAWVERTSLLLRNDRFDSVQVNYAAELLPSLLSEETKQRIQWDGASALWQWTPEQHALWALALVLGREHPEETEKFVRLSMEPTAKETLATMFRHVTTMRFCKDLNATHEVFAENFRERARTIMERLSELFHTELELNDGHA
jgi:hypothetical protein